MAHDSSLTSEPSNARRYSPRPLTAGEQWTAAALMELRRGGYRPGAWRRFVTDAWQRSRTSREQRPLLARQARRWGGCGAVAWVTAWCAGRRSDRIELRLLPGLAWWLAVWQMLDWHLGMAEGGDGGLARRAGRTRLGRDLDTTADLAFLATAAITAHSAGRLTDLGLWAIGGRDAVGVTLAAGAVLGRARRPAIRARPWGTLLRTAGLAIGTAGQRRTGTVVLVIGCLVPPRLTAPHLSVV